MSTVKQTTTARPKKRLDFVELPDGSRKYSTYDDIYVTPDGKIYKMKPTPDRKTKQRKGYFLTETVSTNGKYNRVRIGSLSCLVHEMVASAFLKPRPTHKHAIFHLDGNLKNNHPSNLLWTIAPDIHTSTKIAEYDVHTLQLLKMYSSINVVSNTRDIAVNIIENVCNGRLRTYEGYIWRYVASGEIPPLEIDFVALPEEL